jgi:hypothetical protein
MMGSCKVDNMVNGPGKNVKPLVPKNVCVCVCVFTQ